MLKDKYTAVWVSHSSISDYLKCPRAYFLKNVYRDPKTHRKISLMQPSLALGQVVHEVIESLSTLPVERRLSTPLIDTFEHTWLRVAGKNGGFMSSEMEEKYKARGREMIERVSNHPGPLLQKAIKIRHELPHFWLSEEDGIILCGKIDWLSYDEATDSVQIIDFKTGKFDEDPDSLQLPIYYLLAKKCQAKPVSGVSYWYIDRDIEPVAMELPSEEESISRVMEPAKRVSLARKLERFVCQYKDGCASCRPLESIIAGKATLIGVNDFGQDLYVID
ncbi:PD-(D/E)XK nuclease family protein [Candidatus Gottesmanbacteria bacterium]|nr:PD-(D/E)XK nuclease family protein [Candidatus Gottesmanbacteria bacterium]